MRVILNRKAYYHFNELVVGASHELLGLSPQSHSQFCQVHFNIILPVSCIFPCVFFQWEDNVKMGLK